MKSALSNRIVNGKQASGPIPWQVAIRAGGPDQNVVCGGTILDSTTVLSAAHCVINDEGQMWLHYFSDWSEDILIRANMFTGRFGVVHILPKKVSGWV